MVIFRDYTTDELVMNLPCDIGNNVKIYPILVKDYKEFNNYIKYIMFSKRHLQLSNEISLLQGVIISYIAAISGGNLDLLNEECTNAMNSVLKDLEQLFSLMLREKIMSMPSKNGGFEFYNKDKSVVINDGNFDIFRIVALKMNMLREPKIYEREIDRIWEEKAMIARSKNSKNIGLGEMLTIVRNVTHEKYEELLNMNVFQLYCDYFRIQQVVNHSDTTLFATVSEKIKPTDFIEGVVEQLYKDPTKDLNVKNDFTKYV